MRFKTSIRQRRRIQEYRRTLKGLTANMYAKILYRSRLRGWAVEYSGEEFRQWIESEELQGLYIDWQNSGYLTKTRPSVDRIDCRKPYVLSNMQLMTFQENREKGEQEKLVLWGKPVVAQCNLVKFQFNSIKEAAATLGVRAGDISAVLHGRQKSAGGYHWRFN